MGVGVYCTTDDVSGLYPGTIANLPAPSIEKQIANASSAIENYTRRIFALGTYTEVQKLIINKDYQLVGITDQWPIQGINSLSYRVLGSQSWVPLDPSAVDYMVDPERFFYYYLGYGLPGAPYINQPSTLSRRTRGTINVSYVAGYTVTPPDITLACVLLTAELLMKDANPTGASSIQVGAEGAQDSISWADGKSRNIEEAKGYLAQYVRWE